MSYELVSDAHMRHLSGCGRPVRTTPEESDNGRFTLKTRQMFSVHTTPEDLKNATIFGDVGSVFGDGCFRKVLLSKCFPSTRKRKFVFKLYPPL